MIHFGEINQKKIIYLIIPIIIAIFEYSFSNNHFDNLYHNHVLMFNICKALSMCLSIFPFIIIKVKKNKEEKEREQVQIKIYQQKYYKKEQKQEQKNIFL